MNLTSGESIILKIGDLKVSDTFDVFGARNGINGVLYQPLVNPRSSFSYAIGSHLALGDAREGLVIKEGENEVYLVYGANRPTSHAQSMAIGFHDTDGYFFLVEFFTMSEIYEQAKPGVAVRAIVKCSSLGGDGNATQIKVLYNSASETRSEADKNDKASLDTLMSRIRNMKAAFSKKNLDMLYRHRKAK